MATAKNTKKKTEFDEVLQQIKEYWPDFPITRQNMINPTSDFVVQFYSRFISQFNEIMYDITGSLYTQPQLENIDDETQIFIHVSSVFKQLFPITLADIYNPNPIRTKTFFTICIHLLNAIQCMGEDVEQELKTIFEMKFIIPDAEKNHENLLNIIEERVKVISDLKDELANGADKEKGLMEQISKLQEIENKNEKLYVEKQKQLDDWKKEFEAKSLKLKQLLNKESGLAQQTITKDVYDNLQNMLENLKAELKSMKDQDVDIQNLLIQERDELLHCQECLQIIPNPSNVDINSVVTLTENRQQEKDLQYKYNQLSEKIELIRCAVLQQEKKKKQIEEDLKVVMEKMKLATKNEVEELELKKTNKELEDNIQDYISKLNLNACKIEKIQQQRLKLEAVVKNKFSDVIVADQQGKEKFKQFLRDF